MSVPTRTDQFAEMVRQDFVVEQQDLGKSRRGQFFFWAGGLFLSALCFFAVLLQVALMPIDDRGDGPKGEPQLSVVVFSDPPGAQVSQRNPDEREPTTRGVSGGSPILLQELASGQEAVFTLSMPGYEPEEVRVPLADLYNGIWPSEKEPVVRLKPANPVAYLVDYRPLASAIMLAALASMIVSAGFAVRELRWLRRYDRINQGLGSDDLLLGMTVLGYRIIARLGVGGEGGVYKAVPARTLDEKQPVALKIINIPEPTPEAEQRFFRQMRSCQTLDHPCVMKVYAHGRTGNSFVAACQYIDGGEFEPTACRADMERFVRLAEALDYLHHNGVVHRDVKAANVMLQADGVPVLIDFGYARDHNQASVTRTGQGFGTPTHMPPEQILDSKTATGRSDQFSFGAMLYHTLSGKSPFPTESELMVMLSHRLYQEYTPFREVAPQFPDEVHEILTRMLARDPQERFANISEPTRRIRELLWSQLP